MLITKDIESQINNIFAVVFQETDDCFEYLKDEICRVGIDDAIVSAGFEFKTIPVMQIIHLALRAEAELNSEDLGA
jgi:hypothetical protein